MAHRRTSFRIDIIFCIGLCITNISAPNVPDEEIDLDDTTENGTNAAKYLNVITLFARAMNAKLTDEANSQGNKSAKTLKTLNETMTKIDETLQQIKLYRYRSKKILNARDVSEFFHYTTPLLNNYKELMIGKYYTSTLNKNRAYATKAHFFRLFTWFKYNMRVNSTEPIQDIENAVNEILETRKTEPQLQNILSYLFLDWDLEAECFKIKTLKDLKEFGVKRDRVVDFCLLLGQTSEAVARDNTINMPYCENLEPYMSFLNAVVAKSRTNAFEEIFKKAPEEILVALFEAAHTKCGTPFQRVDIEKIQLHLEESPTVRDRMLYLRNIMAVFSQTVQDKILTAGQKLAAEDLKNTLLLENIPIGDEKYDLLEYKAMLTLVLPIFDVYHNKMLFFEKKRQLTIPQTTCYQTLINWLKERINKVVISRDNFDAIPRTMSFVTSGIPLVAHVENGQEIQCELPQDE